MANASPSQTITELTTIYDPKTIQGDRRCSGFRVKCLADSTAAVNVRCAGMHAATEFLRLDPGEHIDFLNRENDLGAIQVEDAESGGCDISYGIFAI